MSGERLSEHWLRGVELNRIDRAARRAAESERGDDIALHCTEVAMMVDEIRHHRQTTLTAPEREALVFARECVEFMQGPPGRPSKDVAAKVRLALLVLTKLTQEKAAFDALAAREEQG